MTASLQRLSSGYLRKNSKATLSGVIEIGTVKSATTNGEDVTAEYVDLVARKVSYQNRIVQYNEIIKKK